MPSTKLGWVTKIIACFLHQKYSHFLFSPCFFFPDCCQNYICRKLKWLFLEVSKYQNLCDSFIRHFLAISTLTYWMVAKRVGKPFDCFFWYYLDDLKKSQFLCKYQPRVGCFDFWPPCFWPCINMYVSLFSFCS